MEGTWLRGYCLPTPSSQCPRATWAPEVPGGWAEASANSLVSASPSSTASLQCASSSLRATFSLCQLFFSMSASPIVSRHPHFSYSGAFSSLCQLLCVRLCVSSPFVTCVFVSPCLCVSIPAALSMSVSPYQLLPPCVSSSLSSVLLDSLPTATPLGAPPARQTSDCKSVPRGAPHAGPNTSEPRGCSVSC